MAFFHQIHDDNDINEQSMSGYSSQEHRTVPAFVFGSSKPPSSILCNTKQEEKNRGYDYQFIKPGPSGDCICTICHLVARNAHQSSCCGKIFCEVCINKLKNSSWKVNCPNCRQYFHYFKDIKTNREIQSLKIYCTNHSKGCLWEDELNKVEEHIKICPYQIIECEKKCEQKTQRQLMKAHLENECPNRNVRCIHCKEIGTWAFINGNHFNVCPDLFLLCLNPGCGEQFKRRYLDTHQEICPKQAVPCPYINVGCTLTFKHEDIVKHKQEHVEKHLSLAVKKIEKLEIQQQTAPLVLKIEMFDGSTPVRSQPFCTSNGGYKMSLLVKPNGFQQFGKTWVSCSIDIVPGKYDDILEWPFKGEVTIELLNQLEDKNHVQHTVCYEQEAEEYKKWQQIRYQYTEQKTCKTKTQDGKIERFISHAELGLNDPVINDIFGVKLPPTVQFLVNSTLYLRVKVKEYSKTKPWLVTVPLESKPNQITRVQISPRKWKK